MVEDSRSQAEVLKALLKSEGHQVEVFAEGQACIDAMKMQTFDFFVIDWTLPDMGGDDVLKHVGEKCVWDVPIIFCTARVSEENAADILRNLGRVLPREELLSSVWARDSEVDSRTVDTHADRLRKKLGLGGESGLMLSSVYGQGYRLDTVQ